MATTIPGMEGKIYKMTVKEASQIFGITNVQTKDGTLLTDDTLITVCIIDRNYPKEPSGEYMMITTLGNDTIEFDSDKLYIEIIDSEECDKVTSDEVQRSRRETVRSTYSMQLDYDWENATSALKPFKRLCDDEITCNSAQLSIILQTLGLNNNEQTEIIKRCKGKEITFTYQAGQPVISVPTSSEEPYYGGYPYTIELAKLTNGVGINPDETEYYADALISQER